MSSIGIKDVAAIAGVSITTVSRALRNPGRVSEATREKVLAAVNKAGYTPNKFGVGLRTAKSGNIVAIIPDVSDSFNFGVIRAIGRAANKQGYSVLLGDTHGSEERERAYADMVKSRHADGVILFSQHLPFEIEADKPAAQQLPPLVNSCEPVPMPGIPTVTIDNTAAAGEATAHLIGLGHKNIAVITGNMDSPSSRDRLQGFRRAMQAAGLAVNERYIVNGKYTVESGHQGTNQLLLRRDRPSAIFCFSDEMALGCYSSLQEHGFGVPGDMSVMGFDDIHYARHFSPPLTTVAQPVEDIGTHCVDLLLKVMNGDQLDKDLYILPHKLVVRGSTAPLRQ